MDEPWYVRVDREAGEKIAALLELPLAEFREEIGSEGTFDPWELFPLYGTYCSEFDECAIDVLTELQDIDKRRDDLGAEMRPYVGNAPRTRLVEGVSNMRTPATARFGARIGYASQRQNKQALYEPGIPLVPLESTVQLGVGRKLCATCVGG